MASVKETKLHILKSHGPTEWLSNCGLSVDAYDVAKVGEVATCKTCIAVEGKGGK